MMHTSSPLVRELSTRRMTLRGAVALFIAREMMDHAPGGRFGLFTMSSGAFYPL